MRERGGKELKPIVGLVAVALSKHPAVFGHGLGAFPLRVFCRVLALLPLPALRRAPPAARAPRADAPPCAAYAARARLR